MRKVVLSILLLVSATAFVGCTAIPSTLSDPARNINESNNARMIDDIESIAAAISLYQVDNGGLFPTFGGKELPSVTIRNIMEVGAPASELDGISPTYMTSLPLDPHGNEYRVGQIGGVSIVAGVLSDGSIYTKTSD